MSGALKDFFDRTYYGVIDKTDGLPYCLYIRAGHDGTGTRRGLETIVTDLGWRAVQEPLVRRGQWQDGFAHASPPLRMTLASRLQARPFCPRSQPRRSRADPAEPDKSIERRG